MNAQEARDLMAGSAAGIMANAFETIRTEAKNSGTGVKLNLNNVPVKTMQVVGIALTDLGFAVSTHWDPAGFSYLDVSWVSGY